MRECEDCRTSPLLSQYSQESRRTSNENTDLNCRIVTIHALKWKGFRDT